MNFTVIDVETANADMASICQIGLAKYKNGVVSEEWSTLINPNDYFAGINVSVHGITDGDVEGAPIISDVHDVICDFMNDTICVSHTQFDRLSIIKALHEESLELTNVTWLDSAKVTRRTWSDLAYSGYGLANVCKMIGYDFKHHDALEDAKASGQILLEAIKESGYSLEQWVEKTTTSIGSPSLIRREGNPDGVLFGEKIVFTGALQIPRKEASAIASNAGCAVDKGVTKSTTLLVVGDQDIQKLAGNSKSTKHRKAEDLIAKGQQMRILMESDFKALVDY